MIIGNENNLVYPGYNKDENYKVYHLPTDLSKLVKGEWYIVGDYIYEYIGEISGDIKQNLPEGCICKYINRYMINDYDENSIDKVEMHIKNLEFLSEDKDTVSDILTKYAVDFKAGNNKAIEVEKKLRNTGDVYIPEIKEDDDVLTRMIKQLVIQKRIIMNSYKDDSRSNYQVDNLRSALNGTTANMTITKCLDWCDLLNAHWTFEIMDDFTSKNNIHPLNTKLVIAKDKDLWVDYGEPEKGVYKVPLSDKDDPLKRLIKVAVIMKHVVPTDYRDYGSSKHLFNNMMSSLKRKGRMMIMYFIYWCEILGMKFKFTIDDGEGHVVTGTNLIEDKI